MFFESQKVLENSWISDFGIFDKIVNEKLQHDFLLFYVFGIGLKPTVLL